MYTHVLLDLDHTLLDTDESLRLSFHDAMVAEGFENAGPEAADRYAKFRQINHGLWRQVEAGEFTPQQVHVERFVRLAGELGLDAAPQVMADAFALGMGRHGELYIGVRDLLDTLAEHCTMALVTNGLSPIQRARIERLDLERYFAAVTISAEVGVAKPDPAIFDLTFAELGEPDRALAIMVGDNAGSDIAGGNNAGIATCWYNPHGASASEIHAADYEIQILADLVPVVNGTLGQRPSRNG